MKKSYKSVSSSGFVPEGRFSKKQIIGAALIFSLLFLAIGGYVGFTLANPSPSESLYGESGIYPGAPAYTVWREGYTYYCKDKNGHIPSWGETSNATYIIQMAIDSLTNGGLIYLCEATYVISATINIRYDYITIKGAGPYATILQLGVNANCDVFNFTANHGLPRFYSFTLDGNKASNTAGSGFYSRGYEGIYYDLIVHNFSENGFELLSTAGANNRYIMCDSFYNDGSGWVIRHGDTRFTMCRSFSNGEYGLDLLGNTQYIYDCSIFTNTKSGIYADSVGQIHIQGNNIGDNDEHGIFFNASTAGIYAFRIEDNLIRENSQATANTSDAIHLIGDGAPWVDSGLILGNTFQGDSDHRYGIYLGSGVRYILIETNDLKLPSISNATYIDGATNIFIQDNLVS